MGDPEAAPMVFVYSVCSFLKQGRERGFPRAFQLRLSLVGLALVHSRPYLCARRALVETLPRDGDHARIHRSREDGDYDRVV